MNVRRRRVRGGGAPAVAALWLGGVLAVAAAGESAVPWQAEPLRPAAAPPGAPLFSRIAPEESGLTVVNRYDDPEMWGAWFAEFSGGAIGTGLAVGDVDEDGWPDLYVVTRTGGGRLYRQIAPLRFADVTADAGLAEDEGWRTGASFADVDGDGRLDLYVCRLRAPNLLYRNNGDGTFREGAAAAGLAVTAGSVVGAFEDYDRDGDLDVFLVTNLGDAARAPEGDRDFLFRNNGDGTFTDVTAAAGLAVAPERGHAATWWDADNDGWADLHVANDFQASDHLYLNNGDGTFTETTSAALPHLPWFSMGADQGDINNDGRFDLLVADMAGTTHLKRQTFSAGPAGAERAADDPTPQYPLNALYLNAGAGRFLEIAQLAGVERTDWTWSVLFGDFDQDGWEDLHVTNGMVRDFSHQDLIAQMERAGSRGEAVAVVRRSPVLAEANLAFRNTGALRFEECAGEWGLREMGVSFGAVAADLDRDGDLDLVHSNLDGPVSLFRNNSEAHRVVVRLRGRGGNRQAVGARVFATTAAGRQSRRLTLTRGVLSSTLPEAHFGIGTAAAIDSLEIHWPSGVVQTVRGLSANHRFTFAEPAADAPARDGAAPAARPIFRDVALAAGLDHHRQERPFDERTRQPLLPLRRDRLGAGVAFGDADGDGDHDVYFSGAAGQGGVLYVNDGRGGYERSSAVQPWDEAPESDEMAALWLDVNGDGARDLLVTRGGPEAAADSVELTDRLYLGNGDGSFRRAEDAVFPAGAAASTTAVAADFDRDGDLDLFIGGSAVPGRYPAASASRLLENREGRFISVGDRIAPDLGQCGLVTSALWSDANDDGWSDLLIAAEWGPVRLFLNRTGRRLEDATAAAGLAERTGWWNAIEAADVDSDGDTDYVLGNLGLNTPYRASAARPVRLYSGDFDDSGEPDLIEAYVEAGDWRPRRDLSAWSRAMPFFRRRYHTSEAFGRATLAELIDLEAAERVLAATELAHGVLLNDGQGRFRFRELPRLAQAAPVFGVVARDFDGDGSVDVVLAQNRGGAVAGLPRFDGGRGLLLRGGGAGGFGPVALPESGVEVVGEARGAAVADWTGDGWPDVLITRASDRVVALANRGAVEGRNSHVIELVGRPGNPDAFGTAVTIDYRDGRRQRIEVLAGAAHLSQGAPLVFVGYAEGCEPVALRIRWPDGQSEELEWRRQTVLVWPGAP